jgi:2-amino-4-hydroxy-6-hydroxymethyldihydropteridine diphosphokinase
MRVILLLGGNEGDVAAALAAARERVRESVGPIAARSSVHRTAPWGNFDTPQQDFLNQALIVETTLSPEELLDTTQRIEQELGRGRSPFLIFHSAPWNVLLSRLSSVLSVFCENRQFAAAPQRRTAHFVRVLARRLTACGSRPRRTYSSRPIDIDILFYDDLVLRTPRLTIPHPLIQEREFVLAPLGEIAPDLRHPVLELSVSEMLRRLRAGRTPL